MRRAGVAITAAILSASCGIGPSGSWRSAAVPPALINPGTAVVALPGDRVGVFGGVILSSGQPLAQTLIYDSSTNSWGLGSPIPEPRFGESTAVLPDGEVLFAGGFGSNPNGNPPTLATTYIYDPARDTWRRAGDLNQPRADAESVVLDDGKVLIAGGSNDLTAEIFDPSTSRWSRVGSTHEQRTGAILAAQPGQRALAAGGCSGAQGFGQPASSISSAEIFDENDASWHATQRMPEGRCGGTGVPLSGGRTLVLGGYAAAGASLDQALVFDPNGGTWTDAGRIATSAPAFSGSQAPVVTLADHRVLMPIAEQGQRNGRTAAVVIGGELYDPVAGTWSFATSASASTSLVFGPAMVVASAALPPDRALILLENSALIYDAAAAPPATAVLESPALTAGLVGAAIVLVLLIAVVYAAGRRRT